MDGITEDPRPVVVGVDRSDSARDAAVWAADLASVWGAPLRMVHVVPGTPDDGPLAPEPPWLVELRHASERAGADPDVVGVVSGETVQMLAAHTAGARLLVLGSYGDGAWSGMLAGSVALGLIDRVECPVAVVRGPAPQVPPPRSGPIVAGVDGSAAGHEALMLAAGLAVSMGTRLVAVHTWSDVVVAGPHGGTRRRRDDEAAIAAEGGRLLDSELELVTAAHPALRVERELAADTALRCLMHHAGSARMIVVGHRGQREVDGMMLGSTSSGLVEFAPCPVVVVKPAAGAVVDSEDRASETATQ